MRKALRIVIQIDDLPLNREWINREERRIVSGPANRAMRKRVATTIAKDSTYLPQSVLIAANRTMSSRVPSSWQHASRLIPSCIYQAFFRTFNEGTLDATTKASIRWKPILSKPYSVSRRVAAVATPLPLTSAVSQ